MYVLIIIVTFYSPRSCHLVIRLSPVPEISAKTFAVHVDVESAAIA